MAIEDRNLKLGTRLVANYRKQAHVCMVEKAEEGEAILFVLEDGRKFKSPSSAASAVMGGAAVNGWRFWSIQGAEPKGKEGGERPETQAAKPKRLVYRVPNQKGIAEGSEPLVLSGLHEGLRYRREWAAGGLSGRPPWRARANGGGPGGGSERVGTHGATTSSKVRSRVRLCSPNWTKSRTLP